MKMYNPAHPGLLLREYLKGYKITDIAQRLGISRVTLSRIVNGKTAITPNIAVRLSLLLPNTTPNFWLGMQSAYDLWQIENSKTFSIVPLFNNPQNEALHV